MSQDICRLPRQNCIETKCIKTPKISLGRKWPDSSIGVISTCDDNIKLPLHLPGQYNIVALRSQYLL